MNSPLSNDSIFENLGNIVKASNADVYAEENKKLKLLNSELVEALEEITTQFDKVEPLYSKDKNIITKAKELIQKAKQ